MNRYIAFYKPFGVLSQFTSEEDQRNLSEFGLPPDVYAAGRLDKDSEGLLLLTNDGPFIKKISHGESGKTKTYWAQVEGLIDSAALKKLEEGVVIQGKKTKKARALGLPDLDLSPRDPPIRERKSIPTSWLALTLTEGRNRQVRKMCAAVGFPCLRLIRVAIGQLSLDGLEPGGWREVSKKEIL